MQSSTASTALSSSMTGSIGTSNKRVSKQFDNFSSGREFYDDGYTEKECNANELPEAIEADAFFGRAQEFERLKSIQRKIMSPSQRTVRLLLPAVLLWGVSGTGKSRLVQQFLNSCCRCGRRRHSHQQQQQQQQQQQEEGKEDMTVMPDNQASPEQPNDCSCCYVLRGKHDEHTGSSDPFSAIVQALNDFSLQLQNGPIEELERIQDRVKEAFGGSDADNAQEGIERHKHQKHRSALSALIRVVPSLSILIPSSSADDDDSSTFLSGTFSVTKPYLDKNSTQDSISSASQQRHMASKGNTNAASSWNRLQYIFQKFVKAISTKQKPVYIFLDDLQWSSGVSLELLANLLTDPQLQHFMLLGAIRQETDPYNEDEIVPFPDDLPLRASFLDRLQQDGTTLEQITITNLTEREMGIWLSQLLELELDELVPFTQKLHEKTRGNVLFILQALEELKRKNFLVFSRISFQWEYSLDANGDIPVSDNIVSALESKIKQQLSPELQHVLCIAAYVRSNFDLQTLYVILINERNHVSDHGDIIASIIDSEDYSAGQDKLARLLQEAVLENLLVNPLGGSKYRFAHDRIQQAAYGMMPYGEMRDKLRQRIGMCLLEEYRRSKTEFAGLLVNAEEADSLLFVAADHLNSVPTKDHMFSVTLNLEVGETALSMAALVPAAAYLQKASNAFRRVKDPWNEYYDVSLRLHRARSDVELSLGRYDIGCKFGEEVTDKARTLDEKLPTYFAMVQALGRQDLHTEALKMSLKCCYLLGEFPKRWLLTHIARDTVIIKSCMKKFDDAAILQLPFKQDPRKMMASKFMVEIGVRAFLTKNMVLWMVQVCKILRMTFEHGLCENSATAFSALSMIALSSGDHDMAIRCSDLALQIVDMVPNGKDQVGWVYVMTGGYIYSFSKPLTDVHQHLRKGYVAAMEAGDFESGFLNWQTCNLVAYCAGYELVPLMEATEVTLKQYKMYRIDSMTGVVTSFLQLLKQLTGAEPINWSAIEGLANRDISKENLNQADIFTYHLDYFGCVSIACYFRKFAMAEKLLRSFNFTSSHDKAYASILLRELFVGVVSANRYRETGRRKFLRLLRKAVKDLKHMVETTRPNGRHLLSILEAEELAIRKRKKKSPKVKVAYDKAIAEAAKLSRLNDAALVCELAGEHFLQEGQLDEIGDYFMNALRFYEEWGSVAKVNDLKEHRSEYLQEDTCDGTKSSSMVSRMAPGTIASTVSAHRQKLDLSSCISNEKSMFGDHGSRD